MNASEALSRLKKLGVPVATTADAAAVLGLSSSAASHTLRRLAAAQLIAAVREGVWALTDQPDRLGLIEYVTAPYPGYLSLQSALYQHGMIDQIPSMIMSLLWRERRESGHRLLPTAFITFSPRSSMATNQSPVPA